MVRTCGVIDSSERTLISHHTDDVVISWEPADVYYLGDEYGRGLNHGAAWRSPRLLLTTHQRGLVSMNMYSTLLLLLIFYFCIAILQQGNIVFDV